MNLMFKFVLGNTGHSDRWLRSVNKAFRKQASFNRRTVFWVAAATTYMLLQEVRIERLERELEELKDQKEDLYYDA